MNEDDSIFIPIIILNFMIILITFFLLFLYIKTKEFYTYACAHILNLSLILSIDNIMRLILMPKSWNEYQILKYFQAFILVSLDKLILLSLTMQVLIIYIGVMKTGFYFNHEKGIFLTTFLGSIILGLSIGGLYLLFGLVKYGIYYYVEGCRTKIILDTIFNSVFLFLNTFCCVVVIYNIFRMKDKIQRSMIDTDYDLHLFKIILMFISNSLLYIESFLILYDKFPLSNNSIDLVYLITCLIINLIYAINNKLIYETKKLFCKTMCNKQEHHKINTFESSGSYYTSAQVTDI